jgi:hypothetical protein
MRQCWVFQQLLILRGSGAKYLKRQLNQSRQPWSEPESNSSTRMAAARACGCESVPSEGRVDSGTISDKYIFKVQPRHAGLKAGHVQRGRQVKHHSNQNGSWGSFSDFRARPDKQLNQRAPGPSGSRARESANLDRGEMKAWFRELASQRSQKFLDPGPPMPRT